MCRELVEGVGLFVHRQTVEYDSRGLVPARDLDYAPSRRNFSTAASSGCTDEMSQICARLTSIVTPSTASRMSKAAMKPLAEA